MSTTTLISRALDPPATALRVRLLAGRRELIAGATGLILTRHCGEAIIVDGDIVLRVVGIERGSILLAFESATRELIYEVTGPVPHTPVLAQVALEDRP
jgi:hypothetical protein